MHLPVTGSAVTGLHRTPWGSFRLNTMQLQTNSINATGKPMLQRKPDLYLSFGSSELS